MIAIASRVTGLRSVIVLVVAVVAVAAWRAWPVIEEAFTDVRPDARPVTYRYVPLLGPSLEHVVDDADGDYHERPVEAPAGPVKTCLPFLAPILQHPNWQLRITSGNSGCYRNVPTGHFTIASSGEVTWTDRDGPVRYLALSSEQLALVRRLDQLSCVELKGDGYSDHSWLSIGLDLGQYHNDGGARVPAESVLGRAVTAMLEELKEQYRRPRRAVIGSMDLRLVTTERGAVYRVRVTGGRLTVKRGSKLLIDEPVDPDPLIDLVDAALERRVVDNPSVKGALLMDGWSVPVAFERFAREPFKRLARAIDTARHTEGELTEEDLYTYLYRE